MAFSLNSRLLHTKGFGIKSYSSSVAFLKASISTRMHQRQKLIYNVNHFLTAHFTDNAELYKKKKPCSKYKEGVQYTFYLTTEVVVFN